MEVLLSSSLSSRLYIVKVEYEVENESRKRTVSFCKLVV